MAVSTFEGIVKKGRIRLRDNVKLPENTKVYVLIPDLEVAPQAHVYSPRLVHPEKADDFTKQIVDVPADADI